MVDLSIVMLVYQRVPSIKHGDGTFPINWGFYVKITYKWTFFCHVLIIEGYWPVFTALIFCCQVNRKINPTQEVKRRVRHPRATYGPVGAVLDYSDAWINGGCLENETTRAHTEIYIHIDIYIYMYICGRECVYKYVYIYIYMYVCNVM